MKTICLLNEKGGVGKTTLTTHIAAGLAIRGCRVVLVDADPQGHATFALGLREEPGLYELLVRDAAFKDVLRYVPPQNYGVPGEAVAGQLFVVPSNVETRNIANSISDSFKVKQTLAQLEDAIDVVIFDTSPTPSLLHGSIYMATDGIIYPTTCEILSFDGLAKSMVHRQQAQVARLHFGLHEIALMGIVPTMYRSNTLEHKENLRSLRERFGKLVWDPLPQRTIWAEAVNARRPVFSFAPESKSARDAWKLVDRVEGVLHRWDAEDESI